MKKLTGWNVLSVASLSLLATLFLRTTFALDAVPQGGTQQQAVKKDYTLAVESSNGVGQKLLSELDKPKASKENIVISPYSINAVLSMVLNGAGGTTLAETSKYLGANPADVDAFNKSMLALMNELAGADPEVELEVANATFIEKTFGFRKEFLLALRTYLLAKSTAVDFVNGSNDALQKINDWAKLSTNGRIPKIFDSLPADTITVLLNATYFKANWVNPFKDADTSERPFKFADGSSAGVPTMMRGVESFTYLETNAFQSVSLPYGNKRFSMYVLLPKDGKTASDLIPELDGPTFDKHVKAFSSAEGTLYLPKFKLDLSYALNEVLEKSGLAEPFSNSADLSNMTNPAKPGQVSVMKNPVLTSIAHKVFIEVNEKGTEAAAVTGGTFSVTSVTEKPAPFMMDVNKPFLIVIRDSKTGLNLFVGLIAKPKP